MPGPSPFAGEWRDCLLAHYQNVLRNQDALTESTLLGVLLEAGFSDQELAHFKVLATMRAEDMGPEFVPDLDTLQAMAEEAVQQQPDASLPEISEPAVFEAAVLEEAVVLEDDSGPVAVMTAEVAPDEEGLSALPADEEPPDYRASGPEQLSMF